MPLIFDFRLFLPVSIRFFLFRCDECDLFPIVGPRYKCQKCANYDMCENCFRIKKHKHNHVFTKIAEPGIVHRVIIM